MEEEDSLKPIMAYSEAERTQSQMEDEEKVKKVKNGPKLTFFGRNKKKKNVGKERKKSDPNTQITQTSQNGNGKQRNNSQVQSREEGSGAGTGKRPSKVKGKGSFLENHGRDLFASFRTARTARLTSAFTSNSTIATVTTQTTARTGRTGTTNPRTKKVKIRKKVGRPEKCMAAGKFLAALLLFVAAVGIQGYCWSAKSDSGGKNACDFSKDGLNIDFAQMLPFSAVILGMIVLGFSVQLGFTNNDRGCLRGDKALQVKPEAKVRTFVLSFFFVEVAAFVFHISYAVIAFDIFIIPVRMIVIAALALSFPILLYKSGKYKKFVDFHDKRYLVACSCFLLALEDVIFVCVQFAITVDVYDFTPDGLKRGIDVIDSEEVYLVCFLISLVIAMLRVFYIVGFICFANPIFKDQIVAEIVEEEDGTTQRYLSIIPSDVREVLEVRIRKEGCCALIAWALIPGLISFVTIGLFVGAVVISLSQPDLIQDSVFKKLSFKITVGVLSFIIFIISIITFLGCRTWDKGCCVPKNTWYITPFTERMLFSMRGLEIADFITDIGSVALMFRSFKSEIYWQIVMIFSLVATLALNLIYYAFKRQDDHKSYQGKKKKIALSIALLAVEDVFMLPINVFFVLEAPNEFQQVELIAVYIAAVTGAVLFVVRTWSILYHLCCGRPIYTGSLNPTGTIDAGSPADIMLSL